MLESKISRIQRDIETMAQYTATPGNGMTRLSFTEEDRKTRAYICSEMEKAGLHVYTDAAGSICGRRDGVGEGAPIVMIGSHFDSVKNGGNFDGPAGVAAALEVARILHENNISTENPIEFVAMIEEEGTRFGAGLYGSRAMAGQVSNNEIKTFRDANGISLEKALQDFGLDPLKVKDAVRNPEDLKAFIELHIEQGPVLESETLDAGFVSTIVGITRFDIEIEGRADHAGTTPMHMRKDALLASLEVAKTVHDVAYAKGEGTVGTVGIMQIYPGGANIVPGKAFFTVDIRSVEQRNIEDIVKEMKKTLELVSARMGVSVHMERKISVPPIHLDKKIRGIFEQEANHRGISYRTMVSGAGHDAMIMASLTRVGLLFVPSKGGRSHCPEEWTDYEQLKKGVDIALGTILKLAEANI